jgi:hypothetical protein
MEANPLPEAAILAGARMPMLPSSQRNEYSKIKVRRLKMSLTVRCAT